MSRRMERRRPRGAGLACGAERLDGIPARRTFVVFCALLISGFTSSLAPPAMAQCGGPTSSCRSCHETEGFARPDPGEPWHADHAFGDFCADCHGGDRTATDPAVAHATLADPLSAEPAPCAPCHRNAAELVDRYRGSKRALVTPPTGPPRARPGPRPEARSGSKGALALLAALVMAGALYVNWNERRRASGRAFVPGVRRAEWSPYLAGTLLGLVAAASMVFFGHRLSGGGAYQQIAAFAGRLVSPASVYWTRVVVGAARWELAALSGAVIGAFAASRASGTFRVRVMPDSQWQDAFGTSVVKRWVVGFVGALLTEFASGIAGGCTASLAVSGGALLAPGAFVFMFGMFTGGIPVAWWLYRRSP